MVTGIFGGVGGSTIGQKKDLGTYTPCTYAGPAIPTGQTPWQYPLLPQNPGDDVVKIGTKLALRHDATGCLLKWNNSAPCSPSSGISLTFAESSGLDQDAFFQVMPANGHVPVPGAPVYYGQVIRLRHISSGAHLHSHLSHALKGSKQQEVVAYQQTSDDNDHWVVEKFGGADQGEWRASQGLVLRHLNTGKRLHSHSTVLQGNKHEVSAFDGDLDENDCWRVLFN